MDHKKNIKDLPDSPGVYIMKDGEGNVLYIGKAASLKKRVSSYFQKSRALPGRLEMLVSKVKDITYIPTSTEAEALIYENSLIKQIMPKYNVALRDDKSYPLLKLTVNEKFPRLLTTRQAKKDGSRYFGPYTSAKLLRQAIGILKRIFPLRTCNKMPGEVCLNYHIKQCLGPCVGAVDESGYRDIVSQLELFLKGDISGLVKDLTAKMAKAAAGEDFEEAGRLKNMIESLSAVKERKVSYAPADEATELKNILGIAGKLDTIEAFDVSNIMGKLAVGSMVQFHKGRPRKDGYRRFRIKTVSQIDDYGMIREVVNRRYSRLLEEKGAMPDLILIDGGKGHLVVASDELKKLGLSGISVISIAKEFEHIYVKDRNEPLVLPKEAKALHLLRRIRDEAHRFAISYHKILSSREVTSSELDNIKGIGKKRRRALMARFNSIEKIRAVKDIKELLKVKGMDEVSARNIIEYFEGKRA